MYEYMYVCVLLHKRWRIKHCEINALVELIHLWN